MGGLGDKVLGRRVERRVGAHDARLVVAVVPGAIREATPILGHTAIVPTGQHRPKKAVGGGRCGPWRRVWRRRGRQRRGAYTARRRAHLLHAAAVVGVHATAQPCKVGTRGRKVADGEAGGGRIDACRHAYSGETRAGVNNKLPVHASADDGARRLFLGLETGATLARASPTRSRYRLSRQPRCLSTGQWLCSSSPVSTQSAVYSILKRFPSRKRT